MYNEYIKKTNGNKKMTTRHDELRWRDTAEHARQATIDRQTLIKYVRPVKVIVKATLWATIKTYLKG